VPAVHDQLDAGQVGRLVRRQVEHRPGHLLGRVEQLRGDGPGQRRERLLGPSRTDFPDGTSNTIFIAEAARAVPWTKPEDLPYAPDQPLPPLGGLLWGGYFVAFGDGSVRRLYREPSEATLRALITRNGGDEPGPDW
jgi:hypothetical protein